MAATTSDWPPAPTPAAAQAREQYDGAGRGDGKRVAVVHLAGPRRPGCERLSVQRRCRDDQGSGIPPFGGGALGNPFGMRGRHEREEVWRSATRSPSCSPATRPSPAATQRASRASSERARLRELAARHGVGGRPLIIADVEW
jgi:hypothetical protein